MEESDIRKIMGKYGKAWEKQDTALLMECFTKNGTYRESPLAKPYKGHGEIKKFWDNVVCKKTKGIRFRQGNVYVSRDKKTGFAEWECNNMHKQKSGKWRKHRMTGIMVLKMRKGKITSLNEYWNTRTF